MNIPPITVTQVAPLEEVARLCGKAVRCFTQRDKSKRRRRWNYWENQGQKWMARARRCFVVNL